MKQIVQIFLEGESLILRERSILSTSLKNVSTWSITYFKLKSK